MAEWQPLSVRRGRREPDGPYEAVPDHLLHGLDEWLRTVFGWHNSGGMHTDLMAQVAATLRIFVQRTYNPGGISDQIFEALYADSDLYLDCLDICLHLTRARHAETLRSLLLVGASAWTVSSGGTALERRVDESEVAAFERAASPGDAASAELREAWSAVYGRNPDPSDGWDHAIKAVEELLIPLVVPKKDKANLGSVAGELKSNPGRWAFGLPANDVRSNGETLEGLLRHIWPNPDRHGGSAKRSPTQLEAEAAVRVAILVVGLCRGRLVKVP